ncbi:MAG: beta-ketoacyl synthase chain length factor [Pseudodesulfovibrio sp.]|nr:beta-ketoacyl synthase chain length factor [Pseudodesulfovibrio sp.]
MNVTIKGIGIAAPFGGKAELKATVLGEIPPNAPPLYKTTTDKLSKFIPARKLRRIDHFTRMALLAAFRALDDANKVKDLPQNLGIILCTGYGPSQTTFDFLDSIIDDGAKLASPLAFSHSVHNIPTGVLSLLLGAPCPQTTICQLTNPVMTGLQTAALWLAEKRVESVLFGAVDETTPLLEENAHRLAMEKGREISTPVSEGAVFFLLNNQEHGYATIETNTSLSELNNIPLFSHRELPNALNLGTLFGALPVTGAFNLAAAALSIEGTDRNAGYNEGNTWLQVSGRTHA